MNSSQVLKIIIAQTNLFVGDISGNTNKIITLAKRAIEQHSAHLIVFPELTLTGYPPEDLLLRPELTDRIEKALQLLMQTISNITLIIGYPRRYGKALYNCVGVIQDGKLLAEYHKHTLPNYGVFDEKRYFTSGTKPCVITVYGLHIGLTICEDIWVSKPARLAKEAGAQILININASPFHLGKQVERETQVRQRILELGLPVLYVNLVGGQDELVFDGSSFVMDTTGTVIQQASFASEEEMLVTINAIDINNISIDNIDIDTKIQPKSQPHTISPLPNAEAAIYQILVLGVRDYVLKNGFKGAILGLSGGIDSALTLAIAVDALGKDQVHAILMPSRYTADMSNEDAVIEAEALGVTWHSISIESLFQGFLNLLADAFAGAQADVTEENIQARCRGVILMALSNKSGKILLTTGNKSELAVGYATLYGDMAGGFAPLKDVFKTWIYRLARYRNSISPVIPQRVLERSPSAELRPEQTDQDSLPSYDVLDAILRHYIECDNSVAEIIAAGFDPIIVQQVTRMVDRNEYKRRQAPPGVRITQRAFGRDRRYPLTNRF